MKQIYTLFLAGCIAANASAAPMTKRTTAHGEPRLHKTEAAVRKTAPAKATTDETWVDLGTGIYSDALLSNMYKGFENKPVEVTVQKSEQTPGRYRIVNPWPAFIGSADNYLIIDATDPEFVLIPKQITPVNDDVDGETWVASISTIAIDDEIGYGYNKEEFMEDFADLNIYLDKGTIYIPAGSAMFMWPETGDDWVESGEIYDGYLTLPGSDYTDPWESLGEGKFFDGFVPAFLVDGTFAEKTIEIKENADVPGLYKLVAPFADLSDTGRDLIIDCTDPGFVKIETQSTGVFMGEYGLMYLLSLSSNNYETVEDFLEDHPGCNITLSDGRIDIPAGALRAFLPEYDRTHLFRPDDARASYVLLPDYNGITDAVAGNTDGETVYYNLQGVRVANPENGVYIRRQGSNA
ncbi:MAG: hypothetical protein Q4C34_09710, partial [Bacteroidales bacterium]|nr:hypothetical protein [Bacteroidales bacterium]